jgi:hypothetical protein
MIDITNRTLGHSFDSITYEDIEKYFEQVRDETNNLEFKSYGQDEDYNKNFAKLQEPICSFLNSDGGVIIWGSPKTIKDGKRRVCQGQLIPINLSIEKDDVLRKIVSRISPMPAGIRIKTLSKDGFSVLIIEVQKSEYRPHQIDGTYFMRVDANDIPAPHHYVEALFRRITYPDLKGKITFESFSYSIANRPRHRYTYRIELKVGINNNSPLQNEEYLKYSVSSATGTPIDSDDPWPEEPSVYAGIRRANQPMEILHFGQENVRYYSIGFSHEELLLESFLVKVVLRFGGRFSPLKYSFYNLDLSFVDINRYIEDQRYPIPSENIRSKENTLMVDADFSIEDVDQWKSIEYE